MEPNTSDFSDDLSKANLNQGRYSTVHRLQLDRAKRQGLFEKKKDRWRTTACMANQYQGQMGKTVRAVTSIK